MLLERTPEAHKALFPGLPGPPPASSLVLTESRSPRAQVHAKEKNQFERVTSGPPESGSVPLAFFVPPPCPWRIQLQVTKGSYSICLQELQFCWGRSKASERVTERNGPRVQTAAWPGTGTEPPLRPPVHSASAALGWRPGRAPPLLWEVLKDILGSAVQLLGLEETYGKNNL